LKNITHILFLFNFISKFFSLEISPIINKTKANGVSPTLTYKKSEITISNSNINNNNLTGVTNTLGRPDLNKSNKSLTNKVTLSRSSSKEGKRSRAQSSSQAANYSIVNSANQSPNASNFRKVVQLFTSSQMMGKN
jgi:hypothetical protein